MAEGTIAGYLTIALRERGPEPGRRANALPHRSPEHQEPMATSQDPACVQQVGLKSENTEGNSVAAVKSSTRGVPCENGRDPM